LREKERKKINKSAKIGASGDGRGTRDVRELLEAQVLEHSEKFLRV
jgi:hypothetical protein